MAKYENPAELDYRNGGDTVDDFAQKYMRTVDYIIKALNDLRTPTGNTAGVDPEPYMWRIADNKLYIRNADNTDYVLLGDISPNFGFRQSVNDQFITTADLEREGTVVVRDANNKVTGDITGSPDKIAGKLVEVTPTSTNDILAYDATQQAWVKKTLNDYLKKTDDPDYDDLVAEIVDQVITDITPVIFNYWRPDAGGYLTPLGSNVIAPQYGSNNNSMGAADRPWKEGHFDSVKLNGGDLGEYLAESTGYGIVSGCEPTISGLTVTVGAGIVHLADGTRKEIASTNITLDSADSTNPRIDLVYIDSTGTVAKVTGTAAASPSAPSVPSGCVSVAQVSVAAGASTGTINRVQTIAPNLANYGIVNVKDFGAVGDGTHDDTAAIQAAIDYAENVTGANAVIFIPDICLVNSLYISNNGNDDVRKQIIFTGGGGLKSTSDFLFKKNPSYVGSYVGNLVFENLVFISQAGNDFALMTGYPFLRCKWINCTFRYVDHVIKSTSYVQSMLFIACTLVKGNGYIIELQDGSDIVFDDCMFEHKDNGGVLKQNAGGTYGVSMKCHNCCIEGFSGTDELFTLISGSYIISRCQFELIPLLVKILHKNATDSKRLVVSDCSFYVPDIEACTELVCDNGVAINGKRTSIIFNNNSTSVPLIKLDNVSVTVPSQSGPKKFLQFRGNISTAANTYTNGNDTVSFTNGFVEFTGQLPFVISNDCLYTYMQSDNLYIGRFSNIGYIIRDNLLMISKSLGITLNAKETKTITDTLPCKAPYGFMVDNKVEGSYLHHCGTNNDGTQIQLIMQNPSNSAITGNVKIIGYTRIPYLF